MKFTGRIAQVFEPVSGVAASSGNKWMSQEFVFEYFENENDRYSDRVLLKLFGQDRIEKYDLKVGDTCTIGFGHSVREFGGRYYNELRPYSIEKQDMPKEEKEATEPHLPPLEQSQPIVEKPVEGTQKNDDLPF